MNMSPDTDDVMEAISALRGGASIVPEDLDSAVSHVISGMGREAITLCCGKSPEAKRWFVIGAAHQLRTNCGH